MAESQKVSITPLLNKLLNGSATSEECSNGLSLVFKNQLSTAQCASLLTLLQSTRHGTDPEVVAKCATQMRLASAQLDVEALRATIRARHMSSGNYNGALCDLVGTGGDGHQTFNVSTTAAIVASSFLLVAKHGAKASSSKSGAADLLQAIAPKAAKIENIHPGTISKVFEKGNFAFLFASTFHPGMKHVAGVRKDLGIKTIFNILGPLANPAHQLVGAGMYGVANRGIGRMYAEALKLMGSKNAMVVCGAEDLDEISVAGVTFCWRLKERQVREDENAPPQMSVDIVEFQLEPKDFGLPRHELNQVMPGGTPQENAHMLMKLLTPNELPEDDPLLHFILINVAALFVVSGICGEDISNMGEGDSGEMDMAVGPDGGRWREGVRRARYAISSGKALKSLEQYIDFTNIYNHFTTLSRLIGTLLADGFQTTTVPELAAALSAAEMESPQSLAQNRTPLDAIRPSMICDHISIPLLEVLVAHGWDVNQPDPVLSNTTGPGPTLLKLLCRHGDEALIDWLLAHGATVVMDATNPEDPLGYPPLLQLAAEGGRVGVFRKLLDRGAPLGPRVLHGAAECAAASETEDAGAQGRHMSMVRYLVEKLALDVNALDTQPQQPQPNHWGTPLCYVARQRGSAAVARYLLARGADPGVKDGWGYHDAVSLARLFKNHEVLEVLLNALGEQQQQQKHV